MTTPDISIVVCTLNRDAMLRSALASLYDLATDDRFHYEVVVVDNGSTDETPSAIAQASAASKNPLRGVHESAKGVVPARNRGIHESRGRWVAFFDDDQRADPRWLAELHRGAQEKNCPVVGGAVHLSFLKGCDRQLHAAVRMLLGETALPAVQPYGGRLTPGCGNLMIERSVFDQVGKFERTVNGRGEDTDLFSRIERAGLHAWYFPSAIVHHLTPPERLEPAYLLKLARGVGESVALRQFQARSKTSFAALFAAKAVRNALIHFPLAHIAGLCGKNEAALGRRCLLEINRSFLEAGAKLLHPKFPTPIPTAIPIPKT